MIKINADVYEETIYITLFFTNGKYSESSPVSICQENGNFRYIGDMPNDWVKHLNEEHYTCNLVPFIRSHNVNFHRGHSIVSLEGCISGRHVASADVRMEYTRIKPPMFMIKHRCENCGEIVYGDIIYGDDIHFYNSKDSDALYFYALKSDMETCRSLTSHRCDDGSIGRLKCLGAESIKLLGRNEEEVDHEDIRPKQNDII